MNINIEVDNRPIEEQEREQFAMFKDWEFEPNKFKNPYDATICFFDKEKYKRFLDWKKEVA